VANEEFWMHGMRARNCISRSDSLEKLDGELDPKTLLAIVGSYEGEWEILEFSEIETDSDSNTNSNFNSNPDGVNLSKIDPGALNSKKNSWVSNLDKDEYCRYVEDIRSEIKAGQVYQVNACRIIESSSDINLRNLFEKIQIKHKAPMSAYYRSDRWEVASASPERLMKVDSSTGEPVITVSPIKGTSRDGSFLEKDYAENIMIVDLMRNDISPLCKPGSVEVPRLLGVEEHPGLFHLVSDVQGVLKERVSWREILERITPAGSITGAPKSTAREIIAKHEPYRGVYCGTIGWIYQGRADFSVAIRTFFKDLKRDHQKIIFGTGAGITWGSDSNLEWEETQLKARRLIELVGSSYGI
jgi:para-aminobenzoate synthetase component I